MTYVGKFYAVGPLHDDMGLDQVGWAVVVVEPGTNYSVEIVTTSKHKKTASKIAHELNEELSTT
jgi:hypothetical protein